MEVQSEEKGSSLKKKQTNLYQPERSQVDVTQQFKDLSYLKNLTPKVDCWLPNDKMTLNSSRTSVKNNQSLEMSGTHLSVLDTSGNFKSINSNKLLSHHLDSKIGKGTKYVKNSIKADDKTISSIYTEDSPTKRL